MGWIWGEATEIIKSSSWFCVTQDVREGNSIYLIELQRKRMPYMYSLVHTFWEQCGVLFPPPSPPQVYLRGVKNHQIEQQLGGLVGLGNEREGFVFQSNVEPTEPIKIQEIGDNSQSNFSRTQMGNRNRMWKDREQEYHTEAGEN